MVEHNRELPMPATGHSPVWRKSTASGSSNTSCLEVALMPELVLVRDSKDTTGPNLSFTSPMWGVFVGTLR
jgi:hypothetical protein